MKTKYILLLALLGTACASYGTLFTWTNGNGNGDWADTGNWDANGIPLDNNADAGLSLIRTDSIVFSASSMPSLNVPDIGGRNGANVDTPTMLFNSGGTLSLNAGVGGISGLISNQANANRTVFTIGDGVGGGAEDVTINLSLNGALIRHDQGVTHDLLVNADGTLNFTGGVNFSSEPGPPRPRFATITISGGAVGVNGSVLNLTAAPENAVDFTDLGGSFTAGYGNDFADFASVVSSLNVDFLNTSSGTLQAIDNGASFTVVSVIPEPSSFALFALGSLGLLRNRRKRVSTVCQA